MQKHQRERLDRMAANVISRIQHIFLGIIFISLATSCSEEQPEEIQRPLDPWVFRSVLDRQPRMLTLALDSAGYAAYDLSKGTLYKVWKGGVLMEGAAYTDKKNIQPTTWGTAYLTDSLQQFQWRAESANQNQLSEVVSRGYIIRDDQVQLNFDLILSSGDTVRVSEQPELTTNKAGKPGFSRRFTTSNIPKGITVALQSKDTTLELNRNGETSFVTYFDKLPPQSPPQMLAGFDHRGRYWMEKSNCFTCHEIDHNAMGPGLQQIAQRYEKTDEVMEQLTLKVKNGGNGNWGEKMMNPHPTLSNGAIKTMLDYIFSLKPNEEAAVKYQTVVQPQQVEVEKTTKPGFGEALAGVHPSYDLSTLHRPDFQPRVGGLAFLSDGRLLVTTWDTVGGVYLLDGVETGDSSKVTIKRIASGLAEPLGIEVVNDEIFVLQKQELTQLIDHDGDEITDEYRAICNSWGVSDDFHEFSFGLVHQDGYFYVTLSMAMRLIAGEEQKFDRGRTLRISRDGSYDWINYGLRTPNGIGVGPEGELFTTDNQGQWLPANKLIHIKEGEYHGMAWGILDSMEAPSSVAHPAVYLPEDEIGNSPSEPILMQDGPYQGQLLHGDVTHGGIKRNFLEKVDGEYQGAVFRFSQGFEAGVNRLAWGLDGALYVGEVGMVGGWSWQEKQFGLQRMEYNGKSTFEMLAIRAQPRGFEIEFTEPVAEGAELNAEDFTLQQWWYQPTANYGGPKMDLEGLKITRMNLSEDRTRLYLETPNLLKERVIYFRLPADIESESGQSLWSSEAWYTLNSIPEEEKVAALSYPTQ